MATSLSSTIRAQIAAAYTDDQGLVTPAANLNFEALLNWANGVLINTADKVFWKRDTVATGTPKTYDLSGGVTDVFGNALTLAKVSLIAVKNRSTTVGEIISIGAGSNPLINWVMATGDGVKIGPGGFFLIADPSLAAYAVTGGTGDVLTLASAAGSPGFDLVVIGRTA